MITFQSPAIPPNIEVNLTGIRVDSVDPGRNFSILCFSDGEFSGPVSWEYNGGPVPSKSVWWRVCLYVYVCVHVCVLSKILRSLISIQLPTDSTLLYGALKYACMHACMIAHIYIIHV